MYFDLVNKKYDEPSTKNRKKYNNKLQRGCKNSFSIVKSVDRSQQVCSKDENLLLKI